jgi:hypothetical protein
VVAGIDFHIGDTDIRLLSTYWPGSRGGTARPSASGSLWSKLESFLHSSKNHADPLQYIQERLTVLNEEQILLPHSTTLIGGDFNALRAPQLRGRGVHPPFFHGRARLASFMSSLAWASPRSQRTIRDLHRIMRSITYLCRRTRTYFHPVGLFWTMSHGAKKQTIGRWWQTSTSLDTHNLIARGGNGESGESSWWTLIAPTSARFRSSNEP